MIIYLSFTESLFIIPTSVSIYSFLLSRADKVNGHIFIFNDSCQRFFTEMLSVLCFGQSTAPEDELVEMLLGIIFPVKERRDGSERSITKDLTFSKKKKKRDDSPVIRSSLLQLLLEHK